MIYLKTNKDYFSFHFVRILMNKKCFFNFLRSNYKLSKANILNLRSYSNTFDTITKRKRIKLNTDNLDYFR
jgi:hypothetical protein